MIHPVPVERDQVFEGWRTLDRVGVVPGAGFDHALGGADRGIGGLALLRTPGVPLGGLEEFGAHILGREVVDRLVPGLVQHQHPPAVGDMFFHFFQHLRNRAMEAGAGLRVKLDDFRFFRAGNRKMLDGAAGMGRYFTPPFFERKIKIFRTDQISDLAAFVRACNPLGELIELGGQQFGFIGNHHRARHQIK